MWWTLAGTAVLIFAFGGALTAFSVRFDRATYAFFAAGSIAAIVLVRIDDYEEGRGLLIFAVMSIVAMFGYLVVGTVAVWGSKRPRRR